MGEHTHPGAVGPSRSGRPRPAARPAAHAVGRPGGQPAHHIVSPSPSFRGSFTVDAVAACGRGFGVMVVYDRSGRGPPVQVEDVDQLVLGRAGFGQHAAGFGLPAAGGVDQDGLADAGQVGQQLALPTGRGRRARSGGAPGGEPQGQPAGERVWDCGPLLVGSWCLGLNETTCWSRSSRVQPIWRRCTGGRCGSPAAAAPVLVWRSARRLLVFYVVHGPCEWSPDAR